MKLCSCPLKSMYCLKNVQVFTLLWINATTVSLQQTTIFAEYARWLQHHYNIPIPANKCSIENKYTLLNKSNLPLGQCSVFLQGQYPNKSWSTAWKVAPGPLKECSVHFQMCSPRFKGALPPLEKPIFLYNICSIIDKKHPFQKCNMLETVRPIEERSCASYHRATEYCPVWQRMFLWRGNILGKLDLYLTCVFFPLVRSAQPSFRQLRLKEMFSIPSNNHVFV